MEIPEERGHTLYIYGGIWIEGGRGRPLSRTAVEKNEKNRRPALQWRKNRRRINIEVRERFQSLSGGEGYGVRSAGERARRRCAVDGGENRRARANDGKLWGYNGSSGYPLEVCGMPQTSEEDDANTTITVEDDVTIDLNGNDIDGG